MSLQTIMFLAIILLVVFFVIKKKKDAQKQKEAAAQREAEKRAAAAEAKKAEKERVDRLLNPICDHSDCVVCKDRLEEQLFCTCDKSVSCIKKEEYKIGELWDEKLIPVLRARAYSEMERDWDAKQDAKLLMAQKVFEVYAPQLNNDEFINLVIDNIGICGVIQSIVVRYLAKLHRDNFTIDVNKATTYFKVAQLISRQYGLVVESADWLSNPSLYEKENLTYIVRALALFSDKKWISEHILDDSIINFDEVYNDDGTLKDAGGKGIEGDTIFNIINKWTNGNENLEKFEEEKKRREEEERERKEKAKRMEMCNSCKNKHGCLGKGLAAVCPNFEPYNII